MDLSIIVLAYNEAENLPILCQKLNEILSKLNEKYEIILVDDGSTDGTEQIMKELVKNDANVKGIIFRRNYGQTAALSAGIDYAKGNVIIPMDGDLQNDPSDIPHFLSGIKEGYDVVSGWRKNRQDGWLRVFLSNIANKWIAYRTGVNIHDFGCTMKAYRKSYIKNIKLYGDHHRFIPIYTLREGAKISELIVSHNPRIYGKTNYGLSRIFKVILDIELIDYLNKYGQKPIQFFGLVSGFFIVFALAFLFFQFIRWYVWGGVLISPLLLIGTIFFSTGFQMFCTGLLADIIMRTYYESQEKKIYSVRDLIGSFEQ